MEERLSTEDLKPQRPGERVACEKRVKKAGPGKSAEHSRAAASQAGIQSNGGSLEHKWILL